jgi:hypothetical protein
MNSTDMIMAGGFFVLFWTLISTSGMNVERGIGLLCVVWFFIGNFLIIAGLAVSLR